MLGNVFFLPIVFVSTYHSNEDFIKEIGYESSPLINSFWVCSFVAPILLNERIRDLLSRLPLIARDQYTESPWGVSTLDYDLLTILVDLVVLLATNFIAPQ
ncbi:hypothetical protein J6590_016758 [Homalodisca vitripennis]|nr:hypothetical protein J6590_016758 [Homalodisca vitripennis]